MHSLARRGSTTTRQVGRQHTQAAGGGHRSTLMLQAAVLRQYVVHHDKALLAH